MNSIIQHILQIKGNNIWTIHPDATVFDALKIMASKEIGALVVMEGEKMVGIISERDYARKIILEGKASKDTMVKEIMTQEVFTIHPSQTNVEAMELMTIKRIRHLPVMQGDRVIGMISQGDVVRELFYVTKERIKELENQIRKMDQMK